MYYLLVLLLSCAAGQLVASEFPGAGDSSPRLKKSSAPAATEPKAQEAVLFSSLAQSIQNKTLKIAEVKSYLADCKDGKIPDEDARVLGGSYGRIIERNACILKRKIGKEGNSAIQKITFQDLENAVAGLNLLCEFFEQNEKKGRDERIEVSLDRGSWDLRSLRSTLIEWFDPCGFSKIKDEWAGGVKQNFALEAIAAQASSSQKDIEEWVTLKYEDSVIGKLRSIIEREHFSDQNVLAIINDSSHHGVLLRNAIAERGLTEFLRMCKGYVQYAIENPAKENFDQAWFALSILQFANREFRDQKVYNEWRGLRDELLAMEECAPWIFEHVECAVQQGQAGMTKSEKRTAKRWFGALDRCDFKGNEAYEAKRTLLKEAYAQGKKIVRKSKNTQAESGNVQDHFVDSTNTSTLASIFSTKNLVLGAVIVVAAYLGHVSSKKSQKDTPQKANTAA